MKHRKAGWSIIELAIVVLIIGILAALAIPLFAMIIKKSRFSTLANDLRTHSEAFQNYAMEEGDFPSSHTTAGTFVPGMEELLSHKWRDKTPVGGAYTWEFSLDPDPAKTLAYIQVIQQPPNNVFNITLDDFRELDEKLDDGNLGTGLLRTDGVRLQYYLLTGDN